MVEIQLSIFQRQELTWMETKGYLSIVQIKIVGLEVKQNAGESKDCERVIANNIERRKDGEFFYEFGQSNFTEIFSALKCE